MRMADPIPTFSYILNEIRKRHPDFAYVHLTEGDFAKGDSLDFARKIWHADRLASEEGVFISASEHSRESAFKFAEEKGDVIAFGRYFISNPDLVRRLKEDIPFTPFDKNDFYTKMDPKGYVDYPFAETMSSVGEPVTSVVSEIAR